MRSAILPICLLSLISAGAPVLASDDSSWAAFRTAVEEACQAQLAEVSGTTTIMVNPFGSESFGAAVVSVTSDAGTDRMICIYDKATGIAELTAPFEATPGG